MAVAATFVGALAGIAVVLGLIGVGVRRGGFLPLILLGVLAPVIGLVIHFAIGRQREYAADLTGADICGDPRYLISALRKLDAKVRTTPNHGALKHPETAPAFIVAPCPGVHMAWLFSTHPSVSKRIATLERLLRDHA